MQGYKTQEFVKVRVSGSREEILGTIIFGVSGDKPVRCVLAAIVDRQPASQRKAVSSL